MSDKKNGGPRVDGGLRQAWILLPDGRSMRTLVDAVSVENGNLQFSFLVEGQPWILMETSIPVPAIVGIESVEDGILASSSDLPPIYRPLVEVRKFWGLDEI